MPKRSRDAESGSSDSRGVKKQKKMRSNDRYQKGASASEKKNIDAEFSGTGATAGVGALTRINAVAQGNGDSQRVGRYINCKNAYLRILLSSSGAGCCYRIITFLDKQNNASTVSINELLDANSSTVIYNRHLSLGQSHRFQVLSDKTYDMSQPDTVLVSDEVYIPMDVKTVYSGTTGADTETNAIWVCIVSTSTNTTNTYSIAHRVRYTD